MSFCMLSTDHILQVVHVHVITVLFFSTATTCCMLVVSLVVLLFVPIRAGKTNIIIGMYMYVYVASLASRSPNGGEMA